MYNINHAGGGRKESHRIWDLSLREPLNLWAYNNVSCPQCCINSGLGLSLVGKRYSYSKLLHHLSAKAWVQSMGWGKLEMYDYIIIIGGFDMVRPFMIHVQYHRMPRIRHPTEIFLSGIYSWDAKGIWGMSHKRIVVNGKRRQKHLAKYGPLTRYRGLYISKHIEKQSLPLPAEWSCRGVTIEMCQIYTIRWQS